MARSEEKATLNNNIENNENMEIEFSSLERAKL
jgi:hypothetical protein